MNEIYFKYHIKMYTYKYQILLSAFVLLLGIWLSSGTLAPLANSFPDDGLFLVVHKSCNYLYNIDHKDHVGTFKMLNNEPRSEWVNTCFLRRILFPLLAYPFMKTFSFEYGGVIFSAILNLFVFLFFINYIRKAYSDRVSVLIAWLLCLYPGFMYWGGLPYSYACIIPFTILSTILLIEINKTDVFFKICFYSFLMGIMFTGYDLIVFFLPATIYILFIKRSFYTIPFTIFLLIIPSIIVNGFLKYYLDVNSYNVNTSVYLTIFESYINIFKNFNNIEWILEWLKNIFIERRFIATFVHVFLKSNFYALPILFLLVYVYGYFKLKLKVNRIETAILLSVLLLYLFNNIAPSYDGFQMRGAKMARLSHPIFIVYILYLSRFIKEFLNRTLPIKYIKIFYFIFLLAVFFNATVVFGPISKNPIAEKVYLDFYEHTHSKEMFKNLDKYGRRPLGFCKKCIIPK